MALSYEESGVRTFVVHDLERRRGARAGDFLHLPLTRYGHTRSLPRILALRAKFSAYDATCVALAEALGARLVTADQPLVRALRRHTGIDVVSVADER